jgi:hypothetical protein
MSVVKAEFEFIHRVVEPPDAGHYLLEIDQEAEGDIFTPQSIHFQDAGVPCHGRAGGGLTGRCGTERIRV